MGEAAAGGWECQQQKWGWRGSGQEGWSQACCMRRRGAQVTVQPALFAAAAALLWVHRLHTLGAPTTNLTPYLPPPCTPG